MESVIGTNFSDGAAQTTLTEFVIGTNYSDGIRNWHKTTLFELQFRIFYSLPTRKLVNPKRRKWCIVGLYTEMAAASKQRMQVNQNQHVNPVETSYKTPTPHPEINMSILYQLLKYYPTNCHIFFHKRIPFVGWPEGFVSKTSSHMCDITDNVYWKCNRWFNMLVREPPTVGWDYGLCYCWQ